jgi:peptide-methionine (S)-S-oxide reductase
MMIANFAKWLTGGISVVILASVLLVGSFRAVNSEPIKATSIASEKGKQTAVFAGGCFWGMEAVFEHLKGVTDVAPGYSGGNTKDVNYETVGTGQTGHAEVIKITYDPALISYEQLLKVYFLVAHDPTQLNRQYPDIGTQYRSAVFFTNAEQQKSTQSYIKQLNQSRKFAQPIVTQLAPLKEFYMAEEYHQNFIARNPTYPYVVIHDLPKLRSLQRQFPELLKK